MHRNGRRVALLTPEQVRAALLDLAEHGIAAFTHLEHARQVYQQVKEQDRYRIVPLRGGWWAVERI